MSNHTEWGQARDALYTLHPRRRAIKALRPDDEEAISAPFVLGLGNGNGDGLALQGTRRELLDYLAQVTEHLARETDPRPELEQALTRLRTLHQERAAASDAVDLATVRRLDEYEITLLTDVAEAATDVNEQL